MICSDLLLILKAMDSGRSSNWCGIPWVILHKSHILLVRLPPFLPLPAVKEKAYLSGFEKHWGKRAVKADFAMTITGVIFDGLFS